MQEERNWLKSVEVKSSYPLTHVKAEFEPGLNIIIGPNGSGKSMFVKEVYDILKDDSYSTSPFVEIYISGENNLKLTREVTQTMQLAPQDIDWGRRKILRIVSVEDLETGQINDGRTWSEAWSSGSKINNRFIHYGHPINGIGSETPLLRPFSISLVKLDPHLYLEFNKDFHATLNFEKSALRALDVLLIEKGKLNKESVAKTIKIWEKVFFNLSKYLKPLTLIEQVRLTDFIRIDEREKETYISGLQLEFLVHKRWVPYELLSDGTKRLYYIISSLFSMQELLGCEIDCNYFFDKACCIFLEEPELGIHPHQLHKLMLFLREQAQTKQIFLTTHSPQVLDYLEKDQLQRILLCSMHPKEGTKLRHLTKREITRANKFLQKLSIGDYWQHSHLEEDAAQE